MYDKRSSLRGVDPFQESRANQTTKLEALEKKFNDFAAILKGETIIVERVEDGL